MIHPRTVLSVERRPKVRVDMHGNGSLLGEIRPAEPGREYVTLVIGDIRKGEVITQEDVLIALRSTLDAVTRALDARSPN